MKLYDFGRVVVGAFYKIFFRLEIIGRENIPPEGERFVICANHKSYLDPPLIGLCMPFEIGFMAKEELFKNKAFAALITKLGAFPIKRGTSDFGALRSAIKAVKSGRHILVFPEGARSKDGTLRRGKMGAVMIAAKSDASILPIGIDGDYRVFGKVRARIGEPINLDKYIEGRKLTSADMQEITDTELMPRLSELSGIPVKKLPPNAAGMITE